MKLLERIEIHPRVCNGKPVIKGTGIPVPEFFPYRAKTYPGRAGSYSSLLDRQFFHNPWRSQAEEK
ncbi:MAG: hypothetical protein A2W09_01625 [Deltaproteobacteria bacterium RBG_16_50_11]|nr:MAG: hypothetical protein A2W09_01625 [Deltaproteobacteria bacterium RBG_16_50_11]